MKNFSMVWRTLLYTLGVGLLLEIILTFLGMTKGHEIGYLIALPIGFIIAKKQTSKTYESKNIEEVANAKEEAK